MNKIININLAGRLIPIDESAYTALGDYINWLKQFFGKEKGGDEIVHDMEDRIGEIFQQKLKSGSPCIMPEDVQSMIGIMGSPQQIAIEADDSFAGEEKKEPAQEDNNSNNKQGNYINHERKLYRNNKEKVIGGVCSGIADYFNTDPAIIRVAFALVSLAWGAGFLIYFILWAVLPVADTQAIRSPRKRLFRNTDQKVIAGVCSGIAAYFKIEIYIVRLVFVAPLLCSIIFGAFHDTFLFHTLVGGMPAVMVLYIILWASVPAAETVTQKLEMRGENIDVQTLSNSLNPEKEKDGTYSSPAPQKSSTNVFAILMKIFVFCILGFVLIILASIVISILAAVFGIAGAGFVLYPFKGLITESSMLQWALWISALIILLIPFYAIIKLMVRVISGRRTPHNKWLNISLGVLFFAALIVMAVVISNIVGDFRTKYKAKDEIAFMQPANDTLIIRQQGESNVVVSNWGNDDDFFSLQGDTAFALKNVKLSIELSPDSLFHIAVTKSAYGNNAGRAKFLSEKINYALVQNGSALYIPKNISIPRNNPFRAQELLLEVQVPEGKVFKTEDIDDVAYRRYNIHVGGGNINYSDDYNEDAKDWEDGVFHKMAKDSVIQKKYNDTDDDDSTDVDDDN